MCVPDVVKNTNVKVFNLMLRTNVTRQVFVIINNFGTMVNGDANVDN